MTLAKENTKENLEKNQTQAIEEPLTEAYFELSKKIVLEKFKEVEELADIVSYSSKTNPHVTPILEKETKTLFSVHFINELKHIKEYSRVFFISQAMNKKDLSFLFEKGIRRIVFDNEIDLDIALEFIRENSFENIELFLRLKLKENTLKTEQHFVFGMESAIINKRIQEIYADEKLMKKISLLGVHFHRKTQNLAEWKLRYELEDILEPKTLECISVMNIGGGLPSFYANTNLNAMVGIRKKISEFKNFLHTKNIKLMIEPGRFISAPAVRLHTTIKRIFNNTIIVDASVYNTDMDALIVPVKLLVDGEFSKEEYLQSNREQKTTEQETQEIKEETKREEENNKTENNQSTIKKTNKANKRIKPYILKGITPCSLDLFRYRVYLEEVQEGDEIVFTNAGAYNFTTTFCDLDELKTLVVDDFERGVEQ